ncbi:MAG: hypothetical protein AB7I27_01645 [Bacteriovoracaceae bacterium]
MKKFALFAALLMTFVGCSSYKKTEQEIESKAAQSSVSDGKALGGTIHELIASSKTLTEEQKKKLSEIFEANKKKAEELSAKSYHYRAVLIQELLSGSASDEKIKILKKDIRKVENLKLKNTFETVHKVSEIVSKHPEHEQYLHHLINFERATR